jgi:hypothetical protein
MVSVDEVQANDLSLREALTIAANKPGDDSILFQPDVFPLDAPGTITIGSPLEVGGDSTTLDATGRGVAIVAPAAFDMPIIHITGNSNVVIGLTVRGGMAPRIHVDNTETARVDSIRFPPPGATAVRVTDSNQIVLVDLAIEQPAANAIEIASSTDVTVQSTTIEQPRGVAIAASTSTGVDVNTCTIVLDKTALLPGVQFTTVDRSTIHDNVIDPGPVQLINLNSSSDNEIVGNILDGGNVGITLFGDSNANLCLRNIITGCSDEAVAIESTALGNRLVHTTIFRCPGISDGAPDTEIANTFETSEPTDFVDPTSYDFRLAAGSPAIDAATDLGLDLLPDSPERFLGTAPDLGAIETR